MDAKTTNFEERIEELEDDLARAQAHIPRTLAAARQQYEEFLDDAMEAAAENAGAVLRAEIEEMRQMFEHLQPWADLYAGQGEGDGAE